MNSACTWWVLARKIVSVLSINSTQTHWVNAPSPPVKLDQSPWLPVGSLVHCKMLKAAVACGPPHQFHAAKLATIPVTGLCINKALFLTQLTPKPFWVCPRLHAPSHPLIYLTVAHFHLIAMVSQAFHNSNLFFPSSVPTLLLTACPSSYFG